MENQKACDRAETRLQVFSVTVPFTPCSRPVMFYGLVMCDCTSERVKICGKLIISSMDYEATVLGRRECLELAAMLCLCWNKQVITADLNIKLKMELKHPRQEVINQLAYTAVQFARAAFQSRLSVLHASRSDSAQPMGV